MQMQPESEIEANSLRPQPSKSIQFDMFRFALVQVDPIQSCSVHFSSAQLSSCSLPHVDCFEKQQTAKSIKCFAWISINYARLHAIHAVHAVRKHDPNHGALSTL